MIVLEIFRPSFWNVPEAATGDVLLKKVFLKNSQISQRNNLVGVSF